MYYPQNVTLHLPSVLMSRLGLGKYSDWGVTVDDWIASVVVVLSWFVSTDALDVVLLLAAIEDEKSANILHKQLIAG